MQNDGIKLILVDIDYKAVYKNSSTDAKKLYEFCCVECCIKTQQKKKEKQFNKTYNLGPFVTAKLIYNCIATIFLYTPSSTI